MKAGWHEVLCGDLSEEEQKLVGGARRPGRSPLQRKMPEGVANEAGHGTIVAKNDRTVNPNWNAS